LSTTALLPAWLVVRLVNVRWGKQNLSRPLGKDKPGELNHQISAIFKFNKLIMNRLIEDTQLRMGRQPKTILTLAFVL
jgi:hypothetical protein